MGRMLVVDDKAINNDNIVLIDLRNRAEVAKGHIKNAVSIPFDNFEDADDDIPSKAPVVLYGPNSEKAYRLMTKEWKHKKVALIDGGLQSYINRGNQLVQGIPVSKITWKRKLNKNEVNIKDFMKVAKGDGIDHKVILDVRGKEETKAGIFTNAILLPLDKLEAKLSELPKDKELLIHCTTGARAEMAFSVLNKAGFNAKYLVADIECENNTCSAI